MSAPPKTALAAGAAEAAAIRQAVRNADVSLLGEDCRLAEGADAGALTALLSDPAVSGPIYDLPRPLELARVLAWIREALAARESGEGISMLRRDGDGAVYSYSRFTIWPELASAEIAGAYSAARQSAGAGTADALRSFDWMFEHLGARLICVTAAFDNLRTARLIESAGFTPAGERLSMRDDGSERRSLYWEMTREAWRRRRIGEDAG